MKLKNGHDQTDAEMTAAAALLEEIEAAEGAGWIRMGKQGGLPLVYLYPGSVFVSHQPCAVTTVLGSCVAVCLWDVRQGGGGANHFLLPYHVTAAERSARFGDVAVKSLVETLLVTGSSLRDLRAKLFGGASVVEAFRKSTGTLGVRNAEAARALLADYGIPVVTHDLGGQQGRKIVFHINDGAAWVKKL